MSNRPRLAALSHRAIDEGAVFVGTDFGGVGHGYWMPELGVVEARICRGKRGYGLGDAGSGVRDLQRVA